MFALPGVGPTPDGGMTLKFSLIHVFEGPEGRDEHELIGENFDIMQAAEGTGFDIVWVAEHHFSQHGICATPVQALAAVAAATREIHIGPAVVLLPFNQPIRVAEDYAFLDHLSNGRLEFGVGRGYQPAEAVGYGVDLAHSRDIFAEALDIILKAWTQETVSYDGQYFTVPEVRVRPSVYQKPHPPLWMAAISRGSYEIAGRLGANLIYIPSFTQDSPDTSEALALYRKALVANGHDPATKRTAPYKIVYVADSMEQARRELEPRTEWFYKQFTDIVAPPVGQPAVPTYEAYAEARDIVSAVTWDQLVESGAVIAGTPDYVTQRLDETTAQLGVSDVICGTRIGGLDPKKVIRSMDLMGRHVIPHFKTEKVAAQRP